VYNRGSGHSDQLQKQRVTLDLSFPTPLREQERRRDQRVHAWEDGHDLYINTVGFSRLTIANLQKIVPGGAATHAAEDKLTCYAQVLAAQQPPVAL
jgi:hypothetical protein